MFVLGPPSSHPHPDDSTSEEEEEEDSTTVLQKRREECERKARRGEMDPRLEYTFQLLIDATGLPRAEIMDNVFEGNMLDQINEIFLPHMRDKLIWFYQDVEEEIQIPCTETGKGGLRGIQTTAKTQVQSTISYKKKLFLTDGRTCPLTGICIYMFRLNTVKQLPEEGFQKDLYCGVINATKVGLVTTVQRVMEHVFMEVLAQPQIDAEDDEITGNIIRDQLLPGLRSFCSALKVCEEACKTKNIFDDGKNLMENITTYEQMKEYVSEPGSKEILEERLKLWLKRINDVILESEQLRQENDSSGPQEELEYWKKRDAQLSQINSLLGSHEVTATIQCLTMLKSKLIKQWKEVGQGIIYCFNEARDNAKYIQSIEKSCHALYLHDPVIILVCDNLWYFPVVRAQSSVKA